MKILLFVKDAAYGRKDLLEAFSKEGHDVASYPFNYIGGDCPKTQRMENFLPLTMRKQA